MMAGNRWLQRRTRSITTSDALAVTSLDAGYGGLRILSDVSLSVPAGSVTALMGGNGSGKTTLLHTVVGMIPAFAGTVTIDGVPVSGIATPGRVRAGLSFVASDSVFTGLRVREHFDLRRELAVASGLDYEGRLDEILGHFPVLRDRLDQRAGSMSGGERQTLALAAGLLTRPKVMLVDELSLGLAPSVVAQILGMLPKLAADEGTAFLVVEQHPDIVLELADALFILVRGELAYAGSPDRFRADPHELAEFYLGTADDVS